MARAFADITFTESVKAAQTLYGSREFNQRFEKSPEPRNQLKEMDYEFIRSRDSFYQATVGSNGWPYVQHRGGPVGFLQALNDRTLAYPDFNGNRQYISVGNVMANDKICLFLMDYAQQRRLKIWGLCHLVHANDDPTLFAQFNTTTSQVIVERVVIIKIEALEWNCSKYITPRFTEQDILPWIESLRDENIALKQRLVELEGKRHDNAI